MNSSEDSAISYVEEDGNEVIELPPQEDDAKMSPEDKFLYGLNDVPDWSTSFLVGFQHYLAMIGGTIATPLIVCPFLCMSEDDIGRGYLVSTIIFVSGIITLLQTTFGIRLPIIQGGNFAYVVPAITIASTSFPSCSTLNLANMTHVEKTEQWQLRIRELQGAITVSALAQVLVGFTGLVGALLSWITPLSIVPTVTLLGLSLYEQGAKQAAGYWPISCLTIALLVIFSQYMKDIEVPIPVYRLKKGFEISSIKIFTFYPLLIAVAISWTTCGVLTMNDVIPKNSTARTDNAGTLISDTPWFRIPYPGQWGTPTVSVAGVVGVMAGVIASIIESIGDYYACARIVKVPPPPTHAINRGVGIEGIGCVLAGLWGTSSGTASYTGNIVLLGISKVASRRVVQASGFMMLICGVFGKFGAFFATLPQPVLGGIIIYFFGIIAALGLSTLQFVDLRSYRNLFVLGFPIFMGLSLPNWLEKNPNAIQTGSTILDQSLTVLMKTTMFVGGFLGCILDNTVPGTAEERGLVAWEEYLKGGEEALLENNSVEDCYNLPWGMDLIRRHKWFKWVPFSPTYEGITFNKRRFCSSSCRKDQ
ncbi:LOW QUALITY PROTEIN: solute carrier family 23 member 2-like [Palaemon carinicauda]|uniref:LOW QUALITY PROTEIN: solute carrier family 23 member 2-like n=1 Tax=Palaemon carinicauda TaxID=392227 RepID=UPI0035B5C576